MARRSTGMRYSGATISLVRAAGDAVVGYDAPSHAQPRVCCAAGSQDVLDVGRNFRLPRLVRLAPVNWMDMVSPQSPKYCAPRGNVMITGAWTLKTHWRASLPMRRWRIRPVTLPGTGRRWPSSAVEKRPARNGSQGHGQRASVDRAASEFGAQQAGVGVEHQVDAVHPDVVRPQLSAAERGLCWW